LRILDTNSHPHPREEEIAEADATLSANSKSMLGSAYIGIHVRQAASAKELQFYRQVALRIQIVQMNDE
jgi:hypothetical protein